jgi:hypothetical protein
MGQPTLPLPPPTAGRRPFWGNELAARTMGNSPSARFNQIRRGGGDLQNNSPGRFEGVVACHNMGQPTLPLPPPTAGRRPFWGNKLAARTMSDSPSAQSSASPPFFSLFPPAKMDSIASPPTPASADGPTLPSPVVWRLLSILRIL